LIEGMASHQGAGRSNGCGRDMCEMRAGLIIHVEDSIFKFQYVFCRYYRRGIKELGKETGSQIQYC
jgi:hypothetical protein